MHGIHLVAQALTLKKQNVSKKWLLLLPCPPLLPPSGATSTSLRFIYTSKKKKKTLTLLRNIGSAPSHTAQADIPLFQSLSSPLIYQRCVKYVLPCLHVHIRTCILLAVAPVANMSDLVFVGVSSPSANNSNGLTWRFTRSIVYVISLLNNM